MKMTNKINALLKQASREKESATAEKSSVACASRRFPSASEAIAAFKKLKEKLFDIDRWNDESGITSFKLFDENGILRRNKIAARADYIEVTLPGSGKSDWVKITEIHLTANEAAVTVQPSTNPTEKASDEMTVSHFFTNESTNNFCLERIEETLNFCVIGLHEKTNVVDTQNILETVRNFATANLGYYLGIQEGEWKTFCENFLDDKKDNSE